MNLVLLRLSETNGQTLGVLSVMNDKGFSVCELKTLELPWRNNVSGISCIQEGTYNISKRFSKHNGYHFKLENVKDRTMILIHSGNFKTQTQGCILVGVFFKDLDNNYDLDVAQSKNALDILNVLLPNNSTITIIKSIYI